MIDSDFTNVIAEIRQKLLKYPQLRYSASSNHVHIAAPTPTGFSVSIEVDTDSAIVSFDGWHESFTSTREAGECFVMGLSKYCRLKVHMRGHCKYKYTLEYFENDQWLEDSAVGRFFYPFWLKEQITYRQNSVIDLT